MASDPKVVAQNFIHSLDCMPRLLEKYRAENENSKDIPVLKEVVEAMVESLIIASVDHGEGNREWRVKAKNGCQIAYSRFFSQKINFCSKI